ncbi:MAG: hypothetical protein RSC93_09370 [Erysipelotrichaceae bacterium]
MKSACDLLKLPNVSIDRNQFLRSTLIHYVGASVVEDAVLTNPHAAGISIEMLDHIANHLIKQHARLAAKMATLSSIAPGISMYPAIILEGTCYQVNMLQLVSKLLYLYGARCLEDSDEEQLELLLWMMIGSNTAITLFKDGSQVIMKQLLKKFHLSEFTIIINALIGSYINYFATKEYGEECKMQLIKTNCNKKRVAPVALEYKEETRKMKELVLYLKEGYINQKEYDYYLRNEIVYE